MIRPAILWGFCLCGWLLPVAATAQGARDSRVQVTAVDPTCATARASTRRVRRGCA